MKSLITKLEQAEQGSRKLDVVIWHFVETRFQRSDQEGWSIVPRGNRTVKDDVFAPSFTTSLDAKLPGENIVSSYVNVARWTAWHVGPEANAKQVMGTGHTEALARRSAAFKASLKARV